jgi:hypothetical protein
LPLEVMAARLVNKSGAPLPNASSVAPATSAGRCSTFGTPDELFNKDKQRGRPLRAVYDASHCAGQLGKSGPPRPYNKRIISI